MPPRHDTTLIGHPSAFAIEYAVRDQSFVRDVRRVYADVRLWVEGQWGGDVDEGMFLGTMCESLRFLRNRTPLGNALQYHTADQVPSYRDLLADGDWSWGEAFDDFALVYFAVLDERRVHFAWELQDLGRRRHPDYPPGVRRASVDFDTFDRVAGEFLEALNFPED